MRRFAAVTAISLVTLSLTWAAPPRAASQQPTPAVQAGDLLNKAARDFSQGRYAAAARHYRNALKSNATDPTAYLGLSLALKEDGRLDEAKGVLEELIHLYPDFAPAHYNLGETLEAAGDLPGAKASYKRFLELSNGQAPPSPEIRIKFRRLGLL